MTVFVIFFPHPVPDTLQHTVPTAEMQFASPADAYRWLSTRWVDGYEVTAAWGTEEIGTDELRQCLEWFRRTLESPES